MESTTFVLIKAWIVGVECICRYVQFFAYLNPAANYWFRFAIRSDRCRYALCADIPPGSRIGRWRSRWQLLKWGLRAEESPAHLAM